MIALFQYQFAQHALLAAILVSITCGIIGTYVVSKRLVFLGGGIAHAAFGGVGLGVFLGLNPLMTAIPFAVCASVLMGLIQRKTRMNEDAGIGILWAVSMAIGILFIRFKPGYTADLFSYLFGNILTVTKGDLFLMTILNIVIIVTVVILYRELKAVSFDEEFATIVGMPSQLVYFVLLALVALSVVILMRIVGVILVIAFLAIPATIGRSFTYDMKNMMFISMGIGIFSAVLGLFFSYYFDIPSGALIVLVLGGMFCLNIWAQKFRKKKISL